MSQTDAVNRREPESESERRIDRRIEYRGGRPQLDNPTSKESQ
ncbi:hypothetical protein GLA29479_3110 [Lysobacter antibioticus]|jgi:hypothetical protein|nr:hypothetical protein GLA29479_3110 [Lysobacter antibioticus]